MEKIKNGYKRYMDLISKATRNEFRELLKDYTLREIETFFEDAGLVPNTNHLSSVTGQRRTLVEQYYANINFSSPNDCKKLLSVYEEIIFRFERNLQYAPDNQQTIDNLLKRLERDGYKYFNGKLLRNALVKTSSLFDLSEANIEEHIQKANQKIENGDFAGAITNCYTLVECLLKEILSKKEINFNKDEGDIRQLYKLVIDALNLNPKNETLESHLKQILEGLKNIIHGLFPLANKVSDRHHRKFNPHRHHAKLAVNTTFSLCEFLLDTYQYQEQRLNKVAVG